MIPKVQRESQTLSLTWGAAKLDYTTYSYGLFLQGRSAAKLLAPPHSGVGDGFYVV